MIIRFLPLGLIVVLGSFLGCTATMAAQKLDVAIPVFDPGIPQKYEDQEKQGIYPDVRRAESRYLAVQLAAMMTESGRWGAVRVMPSRKNVISDVVVHITIEESTGGSLKLAMSSFDSTGKKIVNKKYKGKVHPRFYRDGRKKTIDPYRPVLAEVAADLYYKVLMYNDKKLSRVKNTTKMRYAIEIAPEAFEGMVKVSNRKGTRYKIKSMPADNDPMMQRISMLKLRDDMFTDAMQITFSNFATNMSADYRQWREANSIEYAAMREAKKKANARIWGGILAAVAGTVVATQTNGSVGDAAAIGLIGGGAVGVASGIKKNKQAKQYRSMMSEHTSSFDKALEPQVIEIENETETLTGTISDQFQQFRNLLARVYASETYAS